jgi:hypothetical protein
MCCSKSKRKPKLKAEYLQLLNIYNRHSFNKNPCMDKWSLHSGNTPWPRHKYRCWNNHHICLTFSYTWHFYIPKVKCKDVPHTISYICLMDHSLIIWVHYLQRWLRLNKKNGQFRNGVTSVADTPRLGQAHRVVTPESIAAVEALVTTDGVRIGEWINWPLVYTTQNYK